MQGYDIDYVKLSQDLGLHKSSLDFIRNKSQKFIDQISKLKDSDSKSALNTSKLSMIFN